MSKIRCAFYFRLLNKSESTLTPDPGNARREAKNNALRKKKVRLAQTAPASMLHKQNKEDKPPNEEVSKVFASGPRASTHRSQDVASSLDTDRKKSVYLQIRGSGKEQHYPQSDDDSGEEGKKKKELPTPSPRTLLDVMIGLNAFSHVPPPRCVTKSPEVIKDNRVLRERRATIDRRASRRDSRASIVSNSSTGSMYDSTENIAEKFIQQWRSRIASRRQSIYGKLAAQNAKQDTYRQRESLALSSVPEFTTPPSLKRKSKWSMSHKMSLNAGQLPVISQNEDQERRELFQAWVKERKDEIEPSERPDSAFLNPQQKTAIRRKSFASWLKKRDLTNPHYSDEEDEDILEYYDPYEIDDGPNDVGDLMKTIFNIKKRFKDPIDSRLKKFYNELDKIKERDEKARRPLSERERKRKWKIALQGLNAALADSSDEEDSYYNTV